MQFFSFRCIVLSKAVFTSEVASVGNVPKDYQRKVLPADTGLEQVVKGANSVDKSHQSSRSR
jgi:hypothetical protein